MDDIEKGILKDMMNFRDDNNIIALKTGKLDGVSAEGFQKFIINFGELIDKEIAGFYYTDIIKNNQDFAIVGRFVNNTRTMSKSPSSYELQTRYTDGEIKLQTHWHTHPSIGYSDSDRTRASDADKSSKQNNIGFGITRNIILTKGMMPIEY